MKAAMLTLAALVASPAAAQLRLDPPFTDGAVLQRDRPVPVRGQAPAGTVVTVSIDGASARATTGKDGRWRALLPAHKAGGPYRLSASAGADRAAIEDVWLGDVWLCSGQSNMEFTLRHVTNAETELSQASHPLLRLFNVPRQSSPTPQAALSAPTNWQASSPASAGDFSAACYVMGRELQQHQGIAIGLIASSWGGSVIEDWISREALGTLPRYRPALALLDRYGRDPKEASAAWTGMVEAWLGAREQPPASLAWRALPNFQPWESWGDPALTSFDGIGYYRAHVTLRADQVAAAELAIGAVDDMDVTRVNGVTVGALESWNAPRRYPVPATALHAGDNVIDVIAIDTGGGGGVWGDAPRGLALADGTMLPLDRWQFARGDTLAATGMPPGLPWLGGSGRTTLYNGMIAPLGDYPVKGFAWYQGEANVADPQGYAELMPLLIADWRKRFGGDPFLMVQLAGFGPLVSQPVDDAWARLRDVQRRVADADPRVGMASALDIGQVRDIHPTNKQDVGHRLALAAERIALGEDVVARGPSPLGVSRTADGIAVRFAYGPLKLAAGGEAIGFELCDASKACRYVPGRLAGDSVILPADAAATEVRYLWQASPLVNLYNAADLPATGFALPIGR